MLAERTTILSALNYKMKPSGWEGRRERERERERESVYVCERERERESW